MTRKLIGSAEVIDGKADLEWVLDDSVLHGKQKLYMAYVETDDYIVCEAWENIHIKNPTALSFPEDEITVSASKSEIEPETVELSVTVTNPNTLDAVEEGIVQFQVLSEMSESYVDIGLPVNVTNGVAVCQYAIPTLPQSQVKIRAFYLSNQTYGTSSTDKELIVHIRGNVILSLEDITANPSEEVTFNISVVNNTTSELSTGTFKFYFDGVLINTVENAGGDKVSMNYILPDDIMGGNHRLRVEYIGDSQFSSTSVSGDVYIRKRIVIDDSPVYAPQTIDEEGVLKQGIAYIPLSLTDLQGNDIETGTVIFKCGGKEEEINLESDDKKEFRYDIPIGKTGGTEIPFTLTYNENDIYRSSTINSKIIVMERTVVTPEHIEANIGDNVTIGAGVESENGNAVNEGEVNFDIEPPEE